MENTPIISNPTIKVERDELLKAVKRSKSSYVRCGSLYIPVDKKVLLDFAYEYIVTYTTSPSGISIWFESVDTFSDES